MSKFKFDGVRLKKNGTTVATIRGHSICNGNSSTVIATVKDKYILKGTGSTKLINIKNDKICDGSGSTALATMKDVNNDIDGPGEVMKAALWFLFCR